MDTFPKVDKRTVRWSRVLLLILILPMTFRTFWYFPGVTPIQEAWFVLCFLYLPLLFFVWILGTQRQVSLFELYMFALVVTIPLLSGMDAWRIFGQPLTYGLLAQRNVMVVAAILFLSRALRRRSINLQEVEKALLILAWGTLFLYGAMRVTIDPANYYTGAPPAFISVTSDGAVFVLQGYFILFAILYYAFRAFREHQPRYYIVALVLFACSVQIKGMRQEILLLLLTFFFFLYRWSDRRRFMALLPKVLLSLAVLIGLLFAIFPNVMVEQLGRYNDAFTVVFTQHNVEDVSANARIGETVVALEGIQKHYILGNGILSHQWQGGSISVLGEYFDASDVGMIGVCYTFGLVGLIMCIGQFGFAWAAAKRLPSGFQSPLLDATKGCIFIIAVSSLSSGACVNDVAVCLFFIVLLKRIAVNSSRTSKPQLVG